MFRPKKKMTVAENETAENLDTTNTKVRTQKAPSHTDVKATSDACIRNIDARIGDIIYNISSSPKGLAFIICTRSFASPDMPDHQSASSQVLNKVLKDLALDVNIHYNASASQMEEIVANYSKKDYSNLGCLVCCLLSHGNVGIVKGSDGKEMRVTDIVEEFSKNKSLEGKPKIFFIDTCMKNMSDRDIQYHRRKGGDRLGHRVLAAADHGSQLVPAARDTYMYYSTSPGKVAWTYADPDKASMFVQGMQMYLKKEPGQPLDVECAMKKVGQWVEAESRQQNDDVEELAQVPCCVSTGHQYVYW